MSLYPDIFIAIADQCNFITKIRLRQICKILYSHIKIDQIPPNYFHRLTPEVISTLPHLSYKKTFILLHCGQKNFCVNIIPKLKKIEQQCLHVKFQNINLHKEEEFLRYHNMDIQSCPILFFFKNGIYENFTCQLQIHWEHSYDEIYQTIQSCLEQQDTELRYQSPYNTSLIYLPYLFRISLDVFDYIL